MGPNERELRLRLLVEVPDPSKPGRAFQDIAQQAQRASLATQDLNRHMQRMQAPGMGPASAAFGFGPGVAAAQANPWVAYRQAAWSHHYQPQAMAQPQMMMPGRGDP